MAAPHNGIRKWGKIVRNFLNSGYAVVRIVDDIDARSSSHCLYQYLKKNNAPVRWFRNQNVIYLFRSDVVTLSLEDAMENNYPQYKEGENL